MKHLIKFMASITVLLILTGCMDTATRLWDGGPYISKKEREAFSQCLDEVRAQDSVMAKMNKTEAERLELLRRTTPCMQRKGY
ncbi:hypothetical protein LVJ82_05125 [Vitreoscilla massiliensis]|uniref:Lipoprotein n=1 Tax=Vitreoscilla massiliensis TaxID=1689272 RepID=A0ABY4E4Y0_9NEIS|nr:hypothetical protein [Vitreoscilla massiliensis]UOO90364.1 hypothetical protein LVJ82_05125 [Vitreoscilla massiliensis]